MADSLYFEHGTTYEYIDTYCNICFEIKGHNIKSYGYCKDCRQFLCTDCLVFHKHVQATNQHIILQGTDIPQSQAEKPAQFEICDVHSKQLKDQFCSNHEILLCASCSSSVHKGCVVLSVKDTCKNIKTTEIEKLYDDLNKYKQTLDKIESSIIANIDALKEDEKNALEEARTIYHKIIAKADELLNKLRTSIEERVKSELGVLEKYQKHIQDTIAHLELSLGVVSKFKGKVIDTKGFLEVRDVLSFTKKGNALTGNINTTKLLMEPSPIIKDFLSSSTVMASMSKIEPKSDAGVIVPDIKFPAPATKTITSKPPLSLSEMKATKINRYDTNVTGDRCPCLITGVAIINNGDKVLVDRNNSRLKMFSQDMKIKSCLTLQDTPRDISVVNDNEVIVRSENNTFVIVSISNIQMSVAKSCKLSFEVTGIAKCNDKFLIISCKPLPASVKLIDLAGNVYWSRTQQGQLMFNSPQCLCHHTYGTSSTVIVADPKENSLTLVIGETGEVITRRKVKGKGPTGVTTDNEGNIYVCYTDTAEVAVLNSDLSEERILLTKQDGLASYPQAITYDDTAHQLTICYLNSVLGRSKSIDCYQLN